MSREPYGMNAILKKIQNDNIQPYEQLPDVPKQRNKSFIDRIVGGMVERAESEGETIDFKIEKKEASPPPPKRSATVLPPMGTRRVKNGIRPSTGVFSLVYDMQELDQDAFMLFYLEASREFEQRTGDDGWTGQVMEHILTKKATEPEYGEPDAPLSSDRTVQEEIIDIIGSTASTNVGGHEVHQQTTEEEQIIEIDPFPCEV